MIFSQLGSGAPKKQTSRGSRVYCQTAGTNKPVGPEVSWACLLTGVGDADCEK